MVRYPLGFIPRSVRYRGVAQEMICVKENTSGSWLVPGGGVHAEPTEEECKGQNEVTGRGREEEFSIRRNERGRFAKLLRATEVSDVEFSK